MPSNRFLLYAGDGVTEIAIPQPVRTVLTQVARGQFATSTPRVARKRTLTWYFRDHGSGLTDAQLMQLSAARPADGLVKLRTWWPAEGLVAAHWADCTAVMSPLFGFGQAHQRNYGLVVDFTEVLHL